MTMRAATSYGFRRICELLEQLWLEKSSIEGRLKQ